MSAITNALEDMIMEAKHLEELRDKASELSMLVEEVISLLQDAGLDGKRHGWLDEMCYDIETEAEEKLEEIERVIKRV
jgi:hypothetical protein